MGGRREGRANASMPTGMETIETAWAVASMARILWRDHFEEMTIRTRCFSRGTNIAVLFPTAVNLLPTRKPREAGDAVELDVPAYGSALSGVREKQCMTSVRKAGISFERELITK
jgi:hypothetical protein